MVREEDLRVRVRVRVGVREEDLRVSVRVGVGVREEDLVEDLDRVHAAAVLLPRLQHLVRGGA